MLEKALQQNHPILSDLDYKKCLEALEGKIYEARYEFMDGYCSGQFEHIFPEDGNYCFSVDWCVTNIDNLDMWCYCLFYDGEEINMPTKFMLMIESFEPILKSKVKNWMSM